MLTHRTLLFKKQMRGNVFELSFLLSAPASMLSFFLSPFVESQGVSLDLLGYIFSISSTGSLFSFLFLPQLLNKYRLRSVLFLVSIAYTAGLLSLMYSYDFTTLTLSLLVTTGTYGCILALLDMYVERGVDNDHTEGEVRGIYLGLQNAAYIISPLVGGLLITMGGYVAFFLGALLSMVPFLLIVITRLPQVVTPHIHYSLKSSFSSIVTSSPLISVFSVYTLLRFFYVLTGIYISLFLLSQNGINYWLTGLIITISLIPQVIVEVPTGVLLGKNDVHEYIGVVGFGIMAITLGIMPYVATSSILVWILLLFAMRIGTSFVEIVSETYFFSHITHSNTPAISAFRAIGPISSIAAPLVGALAMSLFHFEGVFFLLTVLMLFGALASLRLTARA